MTNLNRSILMLAAVTLGAGLAAYPAYAFNPQPDPPAEELTVPDTLKSKSAGAWQWRSVQPGPCRARCSGWRSVSPGPCKAGSCQAPHGQKTGQ
jgi:hypothetical protein